MKHIGARKSFFKLTARYTQTHAERKNGVTNHGRIKDSRRVEHWRKSIRIITNDKGLSRILESTKADYSSAAEQVVKYALGKTQTRERAKVYLQKVLERFWNCTTLDENGGWHIRLHPLAQKRRIPPELLQKFISESQHSMTSVGMQPVHILEIAIRELDKQIAQKN